MTIKYHRLVRPFRPAGTLAMQAIFVAALLQVIACAAMAQPGSGPPLRLVTEDYAPYAWKSDSGELRGVSTDIVRELLQRAQVPVPTPELLPWARAYSIALHTPRACLFSTVRNPDREERFRWIGPIAHLEWVLFAREESTITLSDLEQARGYIIGSYLGNAMVAKLRAKGLRVEETSADSANPRKLLLGRIDLWVVGRLSGLHQIRKLGLSGLKVIYRIDREPMYLACNLAMPKDEASRLNEILRQMRRDKVFERIHAAYGYREGVDEIPVRQESAWR